MKDRPSRPNIELDDGDKYRLFVHTEGNLVYRHVPRKPSWWDESNADQRKTVLEHFDTDDVFTLMIESPCLLVPTS